LSINNKIFKKKEKKEKRREINIIVGTYRIPSQMPLNNAHENGEPILQVFFLKILSCPIEKILCYFWGSRTLDN